MLVEVLATVAAMQRGPGQLRGVGRRPQVRGKEEARPGRLPLLQVLLHGLGDWLRRRQWGRMQVS